MHYLIDDLLELQNNHSVDLPFNILLAGLNKDFLMNLNSFLLSSSVLSTAGGHKYCRFFTMVLKRELNKLHVSFFDFVGDVFEVVLELDGAGETGTLSSFFPSDSSFSATKRTGTGDKRSSVLQSTIRVGFWLETVSILVLKLNEMPY